MTSSKFQFQFSKYLPGLFMGSIFASSLTYAGSRLSQIPLDELFSFSSDTKNTDPESLPKNRAHADDIYAKYSSLPKEYLDCSPDRQRIGYYFTTSKYPHFPVGLTKIPISLKSALTQRTRLIHSKLRAKVLEYELGLPRDAPASKIPSRLRDLLSSRGTVEVPIYFQMVYDSDGFSCMEKYVPAPWNSEKESFAVRWRHFFNNYVHFGTDQEQNIDIHSSERPSIFAFNYSFPNISDFNWGERTLNLYGPIHARLTESAAAVDIGKFFASQVETRYVFIDSPHSWMLLFAPLLVCEPIYRGLRKISRIRQSYIAAARNETYSLVPESWSMMFSRYLVWFTSANLTRIGLNLDFYPDVANYLAFADYIPEPQYLSPVLFEQLTSQALYSSEYNDWINWNSFIFSTASTLDKLDTTSPTPLSWKELYGTGGGSDSDSDSTSKTKLETLSTLPIPSEKVQPAVDRLYHLAQHGYEYNFLPTYQLPTFDETKVSADDSLSRLDDAFAKDFDSDSSYISKVKRPLDSRVEDFDKSSAIHHAILSSRRRGSVLTVHQSPFASQLKERLSGPIDYFIKNDIDKEQLFSLLKKPDRKMVAVPTATDWLRSIFISGEPPLNVVLARIESMDKGKPRGKAVIRF